MAQLVQISFPAEGVAQLLQDTGPRNFSTFAVNEQLLDAVLQVRENGARVVAFGLPAE